MVFKKPAYNRLSRRREGIIDVSGEQLIKMQEDAAKTDCRCPDKAYPYTVQSCQDK